MPPWVCDYIGIPYELEGSSRSGCDCWGLARLVLRDQFGKSLPDFAHFGLTPTELEALVDKSKPLAGVEKIIYPELGCLVLMKIRGAVCHIGVVVGGPGEKNLLHTLYAHDSALDRYDGPSWAKRIEGFYRVV